MPLREATQASAKPLRLVLWGNYGTALGWNISDAQVTELLRNKEHLDSIFLSAEVEASRGTHSSRGSGRGRMNFSVLGQIRALQGEICKEAWQILARDLG